MATFLGHPLYILRTIFTRFILPDWLHDIVSGSINNFNAHQHGMSSYDVRVLYSLCKCL